MIMYGDYLDETKREQLYLTMEENIRENLSALDMLLEAYLRRKGGLENRSILSEA